MSHRYRFAAPDRVKRQTQLGATPARARAATPRMVPGMRSEKFCKFSYATTMSTKRSER